MPRNHKRRPAPRMAPARAASATHKADQRSRARQHVQARRKAVAALIAGLGQLVSLAVLHGTWQVVAIVLLAMLQGPVVHQVRNAVGPPRRVRRGQLEIPRGGYPDLVPPVPKTPPPRAPKGGGGQPRAK